MNEQRSLRVLGVVWAAMTLLALFLVVYCFSTVLMCDVCPDEIAMAGFWGDWLLVGFSATTAGALLGKNRFARPPTIVASLVSLVEVQIFVFMVRAVRQYCFWSA